MSNEQQTGGFWQGNDDVLTEEQAAAVLAGQAIEASQGAEPPQEPEQIIIEDVADQVMEEVQSEEGLDDEDPDSLRKMMSDARLRIAQARLYEMLLEHPLFADVDAPEEAVKNVEKEIKKFVRERLEVFLGIRPDPRLVPAQASEVVGQFNQFEVDVLKRLVSRASGGVSEQIAPSAPAVVRVSAPAKTGTIRPLGSVVVQKPAQRTSAVKVAPKAAVVPQRKPAAPAVQKVVPTSSSRGAPAVMVNLGHEKVLIPAEHDTPLPKAAATMKRSELAERSRRIADRSLRHRNQIPGPGHLPTIPLDQTNAMTTAVVINRTSNSQGSLANGIPLMPLVNNIIAKKLQGENQ